MNTFPMRREDALGHPLVPGDFSQLDFETLWKGRERTTQVEREILRRALLDADRGRLLEVGPGGGRVSAGLRTAFHQYVAVDITPRFLAGSDAAERFGALRYVADVHSLPFSDGAFSAAVCVRVFNFLTEPRRALREFARTLAPGGRLVLSYYCVPSFATIETDLRQGLHPEKRGPEWPVSFEAKEVAMPRRYRVSAWLREAGLVRVREWASGAEDHVYARAIPTAVWIGLSEVLGDVPGLPHRIVLVRKPSIGAAKIAVSSGEFLRCPDCRGIIEVRDGRWQCLACHDEGPVIGGVADLRPKASRAPNDLPIG